MEPAFLKQLHEENDYVEMFWWPFTHEVWIKTWNPTEEPSTTSPLRETINDAAQCLSSEFGVFLLDIVDKVPKHTPIFTNAIWKLAKGTVIKGGKRVLNMPQALHYQHYIDTVRCLDTEYSILVDEEYQNVHDAWAIIIDNINTYAKKDLYPINITVEFRIHGRSQCMLSPSFSDVKGSRHCYIEFLSYYRTPSWDSVSRDIGTAWISNPKFHARPHWAKLFQTVALNNMVPHLKKEYGKNWDRWIELRSQVDPTKMFLNSYLEKMFYGPLEDPDPVTVSSPLNHEKVLENHLVMASEGLKVAEAEQEKNLKIIEEKKKKEEASKPKEEQKEEKEEKEKEDKKEKKPKKEKKEKLVSSRERSATQSPARKKTHKSKRHSDENPKVEKKDEGKKEETKTEEKKEDPKKKDDSKPETPKKEKKRSRSCILS